MPLFAIQQTPTISDSSSVDSVDSTITKVKPKPAYKSPLEEIVYTDADSIITYSMDLKTMFLIGNAVIEYGDIKLEAAYIEYDQQGNEVFAKGLPDSTGKLIGKPVFTEGSQKFDAETIRYNFKTKKGYIENIQTKMNNDGFIAGVKVKKDSSDIMYIKQGDFCPCTDKDAYTNIRVRKIKIIPDDKIVTGPGYLRIGVIPTPLAFPFGFFPNKKGEAAGVIIPTYGESDQLGFFLQNGGYYLPINDHWDTQLTGDIYTNGSYTLRDFTRYKKRYRYTGNFNLTRSVVKIGEPELSTFTENNSFFVKWTHSQDAKAKPNSRFTANVNAGSTNSFTNNINSSTNDFLKNTFKSNVIYSRSFPSKPFNVSISANHNQNNRTKSFDITLPQLTFNMSRVYLPLGFLRKEEAGSQKWYEKIGITYSANFQNRLSTTSDDLRLNNMNNLEKQFRNGVSHQTAASTSLKAWHFTVNPRVSYNEKWYFKTLDKSFDNETQTVKEDTINGFARTGDFNFSTSLTTNVFGMYNFKGEKLKAIRHLISPSVSFGFTPETQRSKYGFVGQDGAYGSYNPYSIGAYTAGDVRESGNINLRLSNTLEAKVASNQDSTSSFKKIPLIEAFNIGSSYNMFADSMKWSSINLDARTRLFKIIDLTSSATLNPYAHDSLGNFYDKAQYDINNKLGTITSGRLAVSLRLKSKKQGSLGRKRMDNGKKEPIFDDFSVPWNFSMGYNVNYRKQFVEDEDDMNVTQALSFNGDFSLFKTMRFGFNSGYDFEEKELTYTTLNLYWDMNCWEGTFSYIPFGTRKSYSIQLNIKSAIMSDLKLKRQQNLDPDSDLLF
jgi:hypothetical protein